MMSVKETLAKLVSFNSVSSLSNAEITSYLSARVTDAGFRVEHFPYRDEQGVEKINMIAYAHAPSLADETIELALVGHTDTVPFDPAWSEALTLTLRDENFYGRGSCDTKGFIAAALTAVEETGTKNLRRPLALIFTADEETGCLGAKRLAGLNVMRARYAIVGEPTSLQPMRAGKGYCLAEVIVRGREGHSAYPALGASAIFRAARLIAHLEKFAQSDLQRDRHEAFDPPYTTLNVGLIKGGTAKNILAGECRFTLEWRPVPNQRATYVLEEMERMIEQERERDSDFDCEIKVIRVDEGSETSADSTLVRMLEEATGKSAGTVAFGTEAPQLREMGAEAVIIGPGNIRVAHCTDEFVPRSELHTCVSLLKHAIERLCL